MRAVGCRHWWYLGHHAHNLSVTCQHTGTSSKTFNNNNYNKIKRNWLIGFVMRRLVVLSACWQALADAMTGISTNAKQGELNGFCDCVAHFANAVCGIVENSSQVCRSHFASFCSRRNCSVKESTETLVLLSVVTWSEMLVCAFDIISQFCHQVYWMLFVTLF